MAIHSFIPHYFDKKPDYEATHRIWLISEIFYIRIHILLIITSTQSILFLHLYSNAIVLYIGIV